MFHSNSTHNGHFGDDTFHAGNHLH